MTHPYKSLPPGIRATVIGTLCLLSLIAGRPTRAQSLNSTDRGRARAMLDAVKDSVKKNYYDQSYHGIDLDARFKAAEGKLEQAASLGQAFGIIAQVLMELEDSHTFFIPPARPGSVEYGWQMQMVGDKCYVVAVRPGSDAEKQGVLTGDEVLAVDGRKPTRGSLWKMQYVYYTLRPQPSIVLTLRGADGRPRELEVKAKVEQGKRILDLTAGRASSDYWKLIREAQAESRLNRHRFYSFGTDLMLWKMPHFDLSDEQVDDMMGKARKHKALVLDLRGNPGGYVTSLERLVGHFFDREMKIADLKGRKELKPMVAKARGDGAFKGKLVVLVDSVSASAAELFARLVQLEGRGAVIGDRTAGAVMRSMSHSFEMGTTTLILYGASISDADVIMSDGKSLERSGVAPDEMLTPSAAELAAKRDPVLARAVAMAGGEMDPGKAGALFPVEWKK